MPGPEVMTDPEAGVQDGPDPGRWFTLAIVVSAVLIVALDTTVLNVAIPTILRDFHTELPALQWVITGYSLTFATFLIIGGRLGDIYGSRRMFIVGAALFGAGSLIASVSNSVPTLVLGEAIIEGVGASLMLPATLAILSTTFRGAERAAAFAVWGATAGAAVAFGPVVGGWLTTEHSWRWSFRINVIVAPLAILGALAFMRVVPRTGRRQRIDLPGALLVAAGMFLLVFGLSEGGSYGWGTSLKTLTLNGVTVWPASAPISVIPVVFAAAVALLATFVAVERRKERLGRDPLFEFSLLRHRRFRYGLLTTSVLAMGQLGFLFVLPLFLQDGKQLTAVDSGLWLLPAGLSIIAGAQVGGRLTRRVGTTAVVRTGLAVQALGLITTALAISPDVTFGWLVPGSLLFGTGVGFASSQLTNVVLSDIPTEKSGAASGANTTVRQAGAALGIAVIGSLLSSQTIRAATHAVEGARTLPPGLRATAIDAIHRNGVSFAPPPGTRAADIATLRHALDHAVASGARPALLFAAAVVTIGAVLSRLIPSMGPHAEPEEVEEVEVVVGGVAASEPVL